MRVYKQKEIKCGFIVLSPDQNVGLLKSTVNSIKTHYDSPIVTIVSKSATDKTIKEMELICPTFQGKSTYSSLMNLGMEKTTENWNFFVFSGSIIRKKMDIKFASFIESEKDILFPIANNKIYFNNATINGLLVHKKTWKEVGEMEEIGSLEYIKTIWANKAIEKGVQFKALTGCKIC